MEEERKGGKEREVRRSKDEEGKDGWRVGGIRNGFTKSLLNMTHTHAPDKTHTYAPDNAYHAFVGCHERQGGHARHGLVREQSLPR